MHFKMMAFATVLSLAAPAVAQTAPATDAPAPKPAKEKKICRRSDAPTGSILGGGSICHTRTEWDKIDGANTRNADDTLERGRSLQNNGSLSR